MYQGRPNRSIRGDEWARYISLKLSLSKHVKISQKRKLFTSTRLQKINSKWKNGKSIEN